MRGWQGFNCNIDSKECDAEPCKNGATCSDSKPKTDIGSFTCICAPGWANGVCGFEVPAEYQAECNVLGWQNSRGPCL